MILYESKEMKRSRNAYVVEAALEYLISLLMTGTFLAQVTMNLGFSDSQTGVISSIISLGCLFQLGSMFLRKRTVKKFVVAMSVANQLLFMLLYVIPVVPVSQSIKQVCFLIFIFTAYGVYYVAHPKKINWLMSLVPDGQRGRFTATKEMVSLAAGIAFSYGMGLVVDSYKASGQMGTAFIISAVVVTALMILHTVTMAISVEIPSDGKHEKASLGGFFRNLLSVTRNKMVVRIAVVFVLWYFATYCTSSFYGTYMLRELGMSQTMTTILVGVSSAVRMIASRPIGSLADRLSFRVSVRICLAIVAVAFLFAAFAMPGTGLVCFLLYYIFHGVAMAGINSALTNLVFDYVSSDQRPDALAFCQSLAGVAGFLVTLVAGWFVDYMQQNGNQLFGMTVYAQQVTSLLAAVVAVAAIVYISLRFPKKQ